MEYLLREQIHSSDHNALHIYYAKLAIDLDILVIDLASGWADIGKGLTARSATRKWREGARSQGSRGSQGASHLCAPRKRRGRAECDNTISERHFVSVKECCYMRLKKGYFRLKVRASVES